MTVREEDKKNSEARYKSRASKTGRTEQNTATGGNMTSQDRKARNTFKKEQDKTRSLDKAERPSKMFSCMAVCVCVV
jgi:hypothetical protein